MLIAQDTQTIIALEVETQNLFREYNVHYCGIGKINAAAKAMEVILKSKCKHILNIGTAGSHKLKTHSLVECSAFVQRDMDLSPLGFPRGETPIDPIAGRIEFATLTDLPKGICGTGDSFEVGPPKLQCDLVDMEAYAIAKVCKKMNVGFTSIKYITDGSDDQAHKDWRENLKPASSELLKIYKSLLLLN